MKTVYLSNYQVTCFNVGFAENFDGNRQRVFAFPIPPQMSNYIQNVLPTIYVMYSFNYRLYVV